MIGNPKPEEHLRNGFKDKKRLAAVSMLNCIVCKELKLKQVTRTEVHHLIGCGLGKKASDLLTISLCSKHHVSGGKGEAIHSTPLWMWEEKFLPQRVLLEKVNQLLNINN